MLFRYPKRNLDRPLITLIKHTTAFLFLVRQNSLLYLHHWKQKPIKIIISEILQRL